LIQYKLKLWKESKKYLLLIINLK